MPSWISSTRSRPAKSTYVRRLLLLLSALWCGLAWPALDAKQQELQDLRGRITQLRDEVEKAAEDRKETADGLRDSERRISEVNRTLRELERREQALAATLRQLGNDSAAIEQQRLEQERRLAELLRQRYLHGGEDSTRLLLSGRNPGDIQRDLEYYAYIGRARAALIRQHKETLARLTAVKTETHQQRANLETVRRERLSQRHALDRVKQSRQVVLAKLSNQIRKQRKEIDSLVRDEARLSRLINKLRRLASAPKPPKKRVQPGIAQSPEGVERVADASLAGINFAGLKGRLALPVAGQILARFGQAREGGGPSWKGLFIAARSGQEVRAVASGRVVFADWLRGFGNLLILDHGEGYLSLYSNNESLYKQVGERIGAGDAIAAVGNTGGQSQPGLYFELRRLGQAFDPLSWVR